MNNEIIQGDAFRIMLLSVVVGGGYLVGCWITAFIIGITDSSIYATKTRMDELDGAVVWFWPISIIFLVAYYIAMLIRVFCMKNKWINCVFNGCWRVLTLPFRPYYVGAFVGRKWQTWMGKCSLWRCGRMDGNPRSKGEGIESDKKIKS